MNLGVNRVVLSATVQRKLFIGSREGFDSVNTDISDMGWMHPGNMKLWLERQGLN